MKTLRYDTYGVQTKILLLFKSLKVRRNNYKMFMYAQGYTY